MDPTFMTIATLAAIPWGIAQLSIRWNPGLQKRKRDRQAFRAITALLAIVATTWETIDHQNKTGAFFFLAIAAAIALDVHWYKFQKTEAGKNHLTEARQERARNNR